MNTRERDNFLQIYEWSGDWSQLPWAHEEPTLFLAELCTQRPAGTALDIGCGAGTDSVFLASRGWQVTSLDFVPKALEFTQQRAQQAGVSVTAVEADITAWEVPQRYDLVLDHGLLHNMDPVRYPAYRERVLRALAGNGDFLLLHWHPLYPGQPDGEAGPRRRSRDEIREFFAPELTERYFAREDFEDLPDVVGGGMSQAYYWFRRNPAHAHPEELLAQLAATLARHGVAPGPATEPDLALLARIVGPGRLGLSQRIIEPAGAVQAVRDWATAHGRDAEQLLDSLARFSSEALGGICTGNPRCAECEVHYCKRKRYR